MENDPKHSLLIQFCLEVIALFVILTVFCGTMVLVHRWAVWVSAPDPPIATRVIGVQHD